MLPPPPDMIWQPAPAGLSDMVIGFAERCDSAALPEARELPLAVPLAQFFLGADYRLDGDGAAPRAALWGPSSQTRRGIADGPMHVFVVMLSLKGAAALARAPVRGMVERVLPLAQFLLPRWRHVPEALTAAGSFAARVAIATAWLSDQVAASAVHAPPVYRLADGVARHRLRGEVGDLAALAGIGPRALQKQFAAEIGWTPKTLLRIARLQRVLRTLHPRSWNEAAGDAWLEFADEAHLSNEFKQLTGLSPSAFVKAKAARGDRLLHTIL